MKIMREQLRQWGACYADERIAELVPEEGLSPLEVAALDIPAEDRMWVLLREDIIPARELRLLACDWAEAACSKTGWDNEHSLNAIAVARRFAVGEVPAAELDAACSAAWAAARSVRAASRAAESATFAAASRAAAWAAAWSASREPEWATWAAAEAKAAEQIAKTAEQIADVVKVLKG